MIKMTVSYSRYLLFLFFANASFQVHADMEKVATVCDTGVCFHWWPKLPQEAGWHHDREASLDSDGNMQLPDGDSFDKAVAVIYATSPYKPRIPDTKTIDILIENDKADFLSHSPDIVIKETTKLFTGDGQALVSYTFTPKNGGNWERVSYGEEGDFYLIFTISARTQEGLIKAMNVYEKFIHDYKEHPDNPVGNKTE